MAPLIQLGRENIRAEKQNENEENLKGQENNPKLINGVGKLVENESVGNE